MAKSIKKNSPGDANGPVIKNNDDTVTYNLEPYLIPIAIILSGVLISLSVFFSLKNLSIGSGSSLGETTEEAGSEDTQVKEVAATTSIKDRPFLGDITKAKIAIVEFSDFECPFCKRHHQQVAPEIIKNYIDTGKAVYAFRDFVAVPTHNPAATKEAYAAACVWELTGFNNQNYFKMVDSLFTASAGNGGGMAEDKMLELGAALGVDKTKLKQCIDSEKFKDKYEKDNTASQEAGAGGSPKFVIGVLKSDGTVDGVLIIGAYPYDTFKSAIEKQLAR